MEVDPQSQKMDAPSAPGARTASAGRAWDPAVGLHDLNLEEWEETGR
jgi:hypothetical protein